MLTVLVGALAACVCSALLTYGLLRLMRSVAPEMEEMPDEWGKRIVHRFRPSDPAWVPHGTLTSYLRQMSEREEPGRDIPQILSRAAGRRKVD